MQRVTLLGVLAKNHVRQRLKSQKIEQLYDGKEFLT